MIKDVFKSFFRTIGRILAYLVIGAGIVYISSQFTHFIMPVSAAVLTKNGYHVTVGNSELPYRTGVGAGGYNRPNILLYNLSEVDVLTAKFNFLILDVCTGNLFTNDNVTIENTGTNAYFDSNSLVIYKTGMSCPFGDGYNGEVIKVQMQVGKYVDSQGDGLYAGSYLKIINTYNYYTTTIFRSAVVSDEDVLTGLLQNNITNDLQREILNEQKEFNKKQDQTNQKLDELNKNQSETNKKIDDVNKNITSEDGPKLDALENSAGWLPAGPLDSILNLPLSLLQNLSTNLSKTCQPVSLPLPYVDKTVELPCISTIYSQIEGLNVWLNTIGIIASAFILFFYLVRLEKWVDDTLTLRENSYIDNWGGM